MFWVHLYATHQTMLLCVSHLMSNMPREDVRLSSVSKERQQLWCWVGGSKLGPDNGPEPPVPRRFANNLLYPRPLIFWRMKMASAFNNSSLPLVRHVISVPSN